MGIPKKPTKREEEFIKSAKLEEKGNIDKRNKKFLIEMEYDLWLSLKMRALKENIPLKDLILNILRKESVS